MKALIKDWIAGVLGISIFISVMILPSVVSYAVMERGYKAIGGEWMLVISVVMAITYLFYRAVARGIRVAYHLGYLAGKSKGDNEND